MNEKNHTLIEWEERYSVGIPVIDSQHKQLLITTNELYKACHLGSDLAKQQFKKTVQEAVTYVKYHFSTEEQIMEKTAFPEITAHKKHHAEFIQKVLTDVTNFESGKQFVPHQFVRFLRDWVLSHIAIVDSKLGDYLLNLQRKGRLGKITMRKQSGTEKQIVLAVDDSKTQLTQFKNILPHYDVYTCESPLQALEMIQNMEVDIILLDLAMEEMNGYDFLRKIKKDQKLCNIPVIVVSGNSFEQHINTSLNLGAADFIAKPARPDHLVQKIKQVLRKKNH
ncbi:MAG: bacteriohemerythrin [Treponema sp.]|nr:bacteriohemerythrin [Treponema sp.]